MPILRPFRTFPKVYFFLYYLFFLCLIQLNEATFNIFPTTILSASHQEPDPHIQSNPIAPQPQTQLPSLLMVSTVDGSVCGYDAQTGEQVFETRNKRPAIEVWAEEGMPQYLPSIDGHLFRIDPTTNKATVVEGRFISKDGPISVNKGHQYPQEQQKQFTSPADSGVFPISNDHSTTDANAFILSYEDSSIVYMDLRTGRVVQEVGHAKPEYTPMPQAHLGTTDPLLVFVKRVVGVQVLEAGTNRMLANASLVHTEPRFYFQDRYLSTLPPIADAFSAQLTDNKKVQVKNLRTGDILWLKDMPTDVVEVHGLGGVRVENTIDDGTKVLPDDTPLGGKQALPVAPNLNGIKPPGFNTDKNEHAIMISEQGGSKYAKVVRVDDDDDLNLPVADGVDDSNWSTGQVSSDATQRKEKRYPLSNYNEFSADERVLGKRFTKYQPNKRTPQGEFGINASLPSSRDFGKSVTIIVLVGIVGYLLGSRPNSDGERKSDRKKSSQTQERDRRQARERISKVNRIDDDGHHSEEEDEISRNSDEPERNDPDDSDDTQRQVDNYGTERNQRDKDMIFESNGSTGSSGGVISNRTMSGWLTVGSLRVSSKVLGQGSHGTVVYEGRLSPGKRKVAVKRLLRAFFESARKEISLLVQLDEASPHVVRYYAVEVDSEFIYLALELCDGSLEDRVTANRAPALPDDYLKGTPPDYTNRALRQLLQGLSDLHKNGVVHRDLKPQNVLITRSANGHGDVKLADVGLALRLADNRSSYTAVANNVGGIGTTGWRAPEVLSAGRQTKAVDVFAAGCIVSYVLTHGQHPFGNAPFGRDGNIAAGTPNLEDLEALGLPEATDIVQKMIDPIAANRPTADEALHHPFFWTSAMKLSFLVDISDRLYALRNDSVRYTEMLDRHPLSRTFLSSWLKLLDIELLIGLGRGYENTASGLLRVIRNKRNHYSELSPELREKIGPIPEDKANTHDQFSSAVLNDKNNSTDDTCWKSNYLTYFTSKVPKLLMCVYQYALENPKLINESHFSRYGFKQPEVERPIIHPQIRRRNFGRPQSELHENREYARANGHVTKNEDENNEQAEEEDINAALPTIEKRLTYHRYELVNLQARSKNLPLYLKSVLDDADIYQPTAYERYKKRLQTNIFDESDFDNDEITTTRPNLNDDDVSEGFQKVAMQRRRSVFPQYARTSAVTASSASSPNRGNNGAGVPTVSQFTGKSRVVDFGSLRNRK